MTGHAGDDPMGSAPPDIGPELEYRLSPQYRRPARTHFLFMAALTVVCVVTRLQVLDGAAIVTGALTIFFAVSYAWRGRFRTRVTSQGIEARGYFNHFVPWEQVRDVEVTEFGPDRVQLGEGPDAPHYTRLRLTGASVSSIRSPGGGMSRLASISVVRADGSKLLLRAPLVSAWAADPDFDRKAWQLDQLCMQHARGAIV
jgi:Bacterial PH domain